MKTQRLLLFLILLPLQLCAAVAPENLAVGDWVFRAGTGRESALIRYLDGGEYSHIGIVVAVAPEIRIVHATTDDDPARPNQVIASSFSEFSAPPLAGKIAAARPVFLNEDERAKLAWLFGNATPIEGETLSGTFIGSPATSANPSTSPRANNRHATAPPSFTTR